MSRQRAEALVVEPGRCRELTSAEPIPVRVRRCRCEQRLRRAEGDLRSLPFDPLGEQRVLQRVVALGQLRAR